MRPLYPLIVTAGSLCIHGGLLIFALQDPRTVIAPEMVTHTMGSTIKIEFVWITYLLLFSSGVALAIVAAVARRTIYEAVALEKTNLQASRYFSPNVFATISQAEDSFFTTSGKLQPVAVLFSDLRDFTALSELLAPQEVLALLSTYHQAMVEIIFQHGGTLDKFIGDGIMATFGTPVARPDDPEQAVRAGIAMQQALDQINRERQLAGAPPLRQGIGIHYGPAIVGNIGTEQRLEYTVIGDTVNVASRLEGACKEHGVSFLISATVERVLPDSIRRSPLARVQIRGKQEPLEVFVVDHEPQEQLTARPLTQALPAS